MAIPNLNAEVLNEKGARALNAPKLSIDDRFDAIDRRIERFTRRIETIEKALARSISTRRTQEPDKIEEDGY